MSKTTKIHNKRRNANVIVLSPMKKPKQCNQKYESDDESESDTLTLSDYEIKKRDIPKTMVQKIIDKNTRVTQNNNNMISKMFTIENTDVLVIKHENGNFWYMAKHICKILGYENTKGAVKRHIGITSKYKKSFADLDVDPPLLKNIKSQTIFIDNTGLMLLVSKSQKTTAIELWEQITKEILPELFATGSYTMPIKDSDIKRLKKNYYSENMLSNWIEINCIYLAYIGEIGGKHYLKFGRSDDFPRRELVEHRKDFHTFNVLGIWKCVANVVAENYLKINFSSNNMLVKLQYKNKKDKTVNKRELVLLNEVKDLDYCLDMIKNVIKTTISPLEKESFDKIKELEHKYELVCNKNDYLQEINTNLRENIDQLKKIVEIYERNNKTTK